MDVAYDSPSVEEASTAALPARPAARKPLNTKLIAAGVAGAVVLAGVGFAILSSQNGRRLAGSRRADSGRPPPRPAWSMPRQAIAAALPGVPCSWLTVGQHGQAGDGSTSVQVSGARR
ncbi:hypothetical protein ACRAWD_15940 [Caulobacter segnis]